MMVSISEFRKWVDNCCRDAEKQDILKEDIVIVLLDKAREILLQAILTKKQAKHA